MRSQRGFTLIELLITVAIVTILAIIGITVFRKVLLASHTSEGTHMLGSIRTAQEAFHSETGQYADVSGGLGVGSLYPNDPPNATKLTSWGIPCSTCSDADAWRRLSVHPDGPVRFGYAAKAGVAGNAPGFPVPTAFPTVAWPSANLLAGDWWVATALADLDGNNAYVTMMSTSWRKEIFVDKEGE